MKAKKLVVYHSEKELETAPLQTGYKPYCVTRDRKRFWLWAKNVAEARVAVSKECGDTVKLVKGRQLQFAALATKAAKLTEAEKAELLEILKQQK
jgi:hypothetical protein